MKKFTRGLMALGLVLAIGACGDTVEVVIPPDPPAPEPPPPPPPPPTPNRAPVAQGTIPAHTVAAGGTVTITAAGFFTDPDGDALAYTASSSNTAVATVAASGANVMVTGVAGGSAVVTITATDPDGLSAAHGVNINVTEEEPETNSPPVAVGSIPAHELEVGGTVTIMATGFFTDPDGDDLAYSVSSSNAAVADASAEGAEVMITGMAGGSAVVTITATDPDGLSAAHGVNVTVTEEEPETNSAPVAVGSIPAHELEAGGTVTITATGFFTDPDGDELAYSVSSSNAGVADASSDGAEVMITGVARGSAVVTITATDPGGLAAAHGVNVTVTQMEPAELTILGFKNIDREYINAADLMKTVDVVIGVEENDEDVDDLSLTIMSASGNTMMVDACTPAAQGMATCRVNTAMAMDPVAGDEMCHGRQMMPSYPNGDYTIMASAMTEGGMTRESDAFGATIMNSEYAMLVHKKGNSVYVSSTGTTWYGGPDAMDGDGNPDLSTADAFKVCPVYFDGTMIDSLDVETMPPTVTLKKGPDFDYWLLSGGKGNAIQEEVKAMLARVSSNGEWTTVDGMDSPLYASAMAHFDFMAPHVPASVDIKVMQGGSPLMAEAGQPYGVGTARSAVQLELSPMIMDGNGSGGVSAPISVAMGNYERPGGFRGGDQRCVMDEDAEATMGDGNMGLKLSSLADGMCYMAKAHPAMDRLGNTEDVDASSGWFEVDGTAPSIGWSPRPYFRESALSDGMIGYLSASDATGVMPGAIMACDDESLDTTCKNRGYKEGHSYTLGAYDASESGYPITLSRRANSSDGMYAVDFSVTDKAMPGNKSMGRAMFTVDGEPPYKSGGTGPASTYHFVSSVDLPFNKTFMDRLSGITDARLLVFTRVDGKGKNGDINQSDGSLCAAHIMADWDAGKVGRGARYLDDRRVSGMSLSVTTPMAGKPAWDDSKQWHIDMGTGEMSTLNGTLTVARPTVSNTAAKLHYGTWVDSSGARYKNVAQEHLCFFAYVEDGARAPTGPGGHGNSTFMHLGTVTVRWVR